MARKGNPGLQTMFDGYNTPDGVFTVPGQTITNNTMVIPPGGGCYNVTYTAPNPNGCPSGDQVETKALLLTTKPTPEINLNGSTAFICQEGGTVPVTITRSSNGANPVLKLDGNAASFGVFDLEAPSSRG
ncbi:MAG: hypothetical protein R2792_01580 [Saprospiraceae bacterium]